MTAARIRSPDRSTWSGNAAALAHHEAGHAVARFLLGLEPRDVVITVRRAGGEIGFSGYVGEHCSGYIPRLADVPIKETRAPDQHSNFCWRVMFPSAVVAAAGPAAQFRFCGDTIGDESDQREIDNLARETLQFSARNPHAFKRAVRIAARRAVGAVTAWAATEALAEELVRRLRLAELHKNATSGDMIESVVTANDVEHILEYAGARRGALAHWQCCARCPPRQSKNTNRRAHPSAPDAGGRVCDGARPPTASGIDLAATIVAPQ